MRYLLLLLFITSVAFGYENVLKMSKGGTGSSSFATGGMCFSDGTVLTTDASNIFWDNVNKKLGVGPGASTPAVRLDLKSNTASDGINLTVANAGEGGQFNFFTRTGSIGSPSNSTSGQVLGDLFFYGYGGGTNRAGSLIRSGQVGNYVSNTVPGNIEFWTGDGTNNLATRMVINPTGNISIPTSGARITGNFGDNTVTNRIAFQSDTTDMLTVLTTIPNGTNTTSGLVAYGASDINNSNGLSALAIGGEARLNAFKTGTAALAPMTFSINGSEKMRIDTAGTVMITNLAGSGTRGVNADASGNLTVALSSAPTVQKFITPGSGTYTTPAGVKYIRVRMAGGGGAGSSDTGYPTQNGSATTFGTSLLVANGGASAEASGAIIQGGTASISAPAYGVAIDGNDRHGWNNSTCTVNSSIRLPAQDGANNPGFGGGGAGNHGTGGNGTPNTGGGGGAGSDSCVVRSAGASGGYVDAIVPNPSATYPYTVGAGATALGGGTGGVGGSGVIIVEEYY